MEIRTEVPFTGQLPGRSTDGPGWGSQRPTGEHSPSVRTSLIVHKDPQRRMVMRWGKRAVIGVMARFWSSNGRGRRGSVTARVAA
jgi:hypothetical protein